MGNNSAKGKRPSFTEIINNNAYAKEALEANREGLARFIRNNGKFLGEKNRSVYRQCKELSEKSGLSIKPQVFSGIKRGTQQICSTYIVYLVGIYWGINGAEMLVREFEGLPKVA